MRELRNGGDWGGWRRMAATAAIVLAGCATPSVPTNYAFKPGAGLGVLYVGYDMQPATPGVTASLFFRETGPSGPTPSSSQQFLLRSGPSKSRLGAGVTEPYAIELPPGNYEFHRYSVTLPGGTLAGNFSTPLRTRVVAGKLNYAGDLQLSVRPSATDLRRYEVALQRTVPPVVPFASIRSLLPAVREADVVVAGLSGPGLQSGGPSSVPGRAATASADEAALELARMKNCLACHATDRRLVGPSYRDVAMRYANDPRVVHALAQKVRQGGTGAWGQVPMPPNPQVSEAEAMTLVSWILSMRSAR